MASYPPPDETGLPIFNPTNYQYASGSLTLAEANQLYAQLSGSVVRGYTTFQAGLGTPSISNSGSTFTVPSSSGQLALVSQIPATTNFVDLTTSQTISGVKTFSAAPVISTITNTGTLTLPTTTGTLALTSQIPTNATYVDLTTNQSVGGTKTFTSSINASSAVSNPWLTPGYAFASSTSSGFYYKNDGSTQQNIGLTVGGKYLFTSGLYIPSNASASSFYNYDGTYIGGFYCSSSTGAGTFRICSSTNYAALTYGGSSDITLTLPTSTDTLTANNSSQTLQNKTFQTSSNTGIASFTATTITTSFNHNLGVNDTISFPNIGSMTGISASTTYTIATVPTTTSFTLSGISSLGGTVGNAYYYVVSRAPANISSSGGVLQITDASNTSNPVVFDTAGATAPTVIACQASGNPIRYVLPSFGGTFGMLSNTQTFNGSKTFSSGLIVSRAGNTSSGSAGLYSNPSTVAMTGTNNYYYSYFNTPPSTGSTTGTSSTVIIAGATTTASNNYSLQILAGQSSLPSGTVGAPSIVFGNNNSSGFYSSGSNVINTSISGVNVLQVNSSGVSIAGGLTLQSGSGSLTFYGTSSVSSTVSVGTYTSGNFTFNYSRIGNVITLSCGGLNLGTNAGTQSNVSLTVNTLASASYLPTTNTYIFPISVYNTSGSSAYVLQITPTAISIGTFGNALSTFNTSGSFNVFGFSITFNI